MCTYLNRRAEFVFLARAGRRQPAAAPPRSRAAAAGSRQPAANSRQPAATQAHAALLVSRGGRGPQSSPPQSSASRPQRPHSRQAKSISHTGPRLQRSAGALVAARDEDVRPRIAPALAAHDELHGGIHGRGLILRKRAFGGAASENQLASSGACFRWGHDRSEGGPERAWRASGSPTAASRHLLPLLTTWSITDPHLR